LCGDEEVGVRHDGEAELRRLGFEAAALAAWMRR
jgi:hypothetical protein